MPASFGCAICQQPIRSPTKKHYLLCPVCLARYCGGKKYAEWPEWVLCLVRQERTARERYSRQSHEWHEESFADWLKDLDVDDKAEALAELSGRWDLLANMRMEAVEVLARLNTEELVILLLHQFGFSYKDIGEILGISEDAAWKRWAIARKRLKALPSGQQPLQP